MSLKFIQILLVALTLSAGLKGYSQDSTVVFEKKVLVIKNDGSQYTGVILTDDAREILLESDQVGKLYIPKHFIKSIQEYKPELIEETAEQDSLKDGETETVIQEEQTVVNQPIQEDIKIEKPDTNLYENFVSTKNILSDNAMPIRPGEAFIKLMPIGIEAGVPLTKFWSLGAFSSYWGLPVGIKTKFSFRLADQAYLSLDLGYGTMAFGTWAGLGIEDGGGVASTTFTFGDREKNISVKAGYGLIHERFWGWDFDPVTQEWIELPEVMLYTNLIFMNVGGMFHLNDHTAFVFDAVGAYVGNSFTVGAGVAARFGRKPRSKWQLGGSLVFSDGAFIPIPIPNLSYTYVFSRRNHP